MKPNLTTDAKSRAGFAALARRWISMSFVALALAGSAGSAMAAEYIGADLSDVKPEDKVAVDRPQPVQLLFEFHTKGAPNGRATKYLKKQVTDVVKASGLFSEVGETAVGNGAVLSVVIDNVIAPKELGAAEAKGIATGATLFIAGSTIADHYVCTVDYIGGPAAPKITRTANHSMFTQMGLINSPPANAVKIGSMKDALEIMVRQIVSNPLNAIAGDPGFKVASDTPVPSPALAPAPEAVPAPPTDMPAASPPVAGEATGRAL